MSMRRTWGSGYMVLSGAAHTPAREDPLTPKQISRCRRPCDFLATSSVPPYGVSPGHESLSGDTPTQVGPSALAQRPWPAAWSRAGPPPPPYVAPAGLLPGRD